MTAVELLPVYHIADESFLIDRGLSHYGGYSTIGCPDSIRDFWRSRPRRAGR